MTDFRVACGKHLRRCFATRNFRSWEEFAGYIGSPKPGHKEGECFLQCALKGSEPKQKANGKTAATNRFLENVGSMSVLAYDVDAGQEPQKVIDELKRRDLAFVAYSSFNDTPDHRKTRFAIKLNKPFEIGDDLRQAKLTWRRLYYGIGTDLGIEYDKACSDLTRVFFTARYPDTADPDTRLFEWSHGTGLELSNWIERANSGGFDSLLPKTPPGSKMGAQRERPSHEDSTAAGVNLMRWVAITDGKLQLNDVVQVNNPDDVLSEDFDKSEVVCPFDDQHKSCPGERSTGFFVSNPSNEHSSFGAHCRHNSCAHRDRLDFVAGLMARGDVTKDDLKRFESYENGHDWTDAQKAEAADVVDGSELPFPFHFDYKTGRVMKEPSEGEPFAVCGRIVPKATIHNEHDTEYGKLIEITTRDGRTKTVKLSDASPAEALKKLRSEGLQVFGSTGAENAFKELVAALNPKTIAVEATRPSFHANNSVFISPLGAVIKKDRGDNKKWILSEGLRVKATPQGTLEDWQQGVAIPALSDPTRIPHLGIGVLAGFVGPLLHLLEDDTCMISLSGPTSRGKSSALKLQASVWTPPTGRESLRFEARGSVNAMEAMVEKGNGVSVGLDELAHNKDVGALIFSLASNQGNNRMKTDGSELRRTRYWNTFVLLSGEQTIEQYVKDAGKSFIGGMAARCADVTVAGLPPHPEPSKIDEILANAGKFYGVAGPLFVQQLMQKEDLDELHRRVAEHQRNLAKDDATGAELRASKPFALLAVAGEIAKRAGVLPDDIDHIACVRWAAKQAQISTAIESLDTVEQSINEVFEFIARNNGGRIVHVSSVGANNNAGYNGAAGWFDRDTRIVYLLWTEFTRVCKTDASAVAKELLSRGVAKPRKKGKRQEPFHSAGLPGRLPPAKHIRIMLDAVERLELRSEISEILREKVIALWGSDAPKEAFLNFKVICDRFEADRASGSVSWH
jgi:hypothetical protein